MANSVLNVGLIGSGGIGAHHRRAWQRIAAAFPAEVQLTAVSTRVASPAAGPFDRRHRHWSDLIADPGVNLVDICLPDGFHAEVLAAALEAGKHVICEKPLAVDPAQATHLLELAASSGRYGSVCLTYRHLPNAGLARELIAGGTLGPVREVRAHYLQSWLTADTPGSWRLEPSGGGVLADLGCHLIDLVDVVCGGLGAIAEVAARSDDPVRRVSWLTGYEGGASGTYAISRTAVGHSNDLQVEISGDGGTLRLSTERPHELLLSTPDGPADQLIRVNDMEREAWLAGWWPAGAELGWNDLFAHQLHDAVTAVLGQHRGTAAPSASLSDAVALDAAVARIRHSLGR